MSEYYARCVDTIADSILIAVKQTNWYDYPQYYDLAFRDVTRDEVAFLQAAARKYAAIPVRRILEPGCGGGRLLVPLAAQGYEMVGFDLNEPSLDYLRRRLRRRGLTADVFVADMADFRLSRPVDLVVNTWNTFRHLTTEAQAHGHLRCVTESLRPGGLFVLGLHLLPLDVDEDSVERWTARHGTTRVTTTLRVVDFNRRRRRERLRLSLVARTPRRTIRLRSEFDFRIYTAGQLRRLLRTVPELELCDVFDFWFDIEEPLELNDEITDTVLVLRKMP